MSFSHDKSVDLRQCGLDVELWTSYTTTITLMYVGVSFYVHGSKGIHGTEREFPDNSNCSSSWNWTHNYSQLCKDEKILMYVIIDMIDDNYLTCIKLTTCWPISVWHEETAETCRSTMINNQSPFQHPQTFQQKYKIEKIWFVACTKNEDMDWRLQS